MVEICYKKDGGKERYIRNADVVTTRAHINITLRNTKTDTKQRGVTKTIANMEKIQINPYALIRTHQLAKMAKTGPNEPLFTLVSGEHITRHRLINFLRRKAARAYPTIPESEWSGISLRKGGATSALRAGVPGETIEKMGHWKSNIYSLCVRGSNIVGVVFPITKYLKLCLLFSGFRTFFKNPINSLGNTFMI